MSADGPAAAPAHDTASAPTVDSGLGDAAVQHLQALLRIDTTNPPGRETPAADYVADLLRAHGIEPTIVGPSPDRRSVLARLPAAVPEHEKSGGPLLLHAHLDVVPAGDLADWTHPPFAGVVDEGWLYGRGAVDAKNMVVLSALVLGRLAKERARLRRDVIFAAVADEEAGMDAGSKWVVDHHPDAVRAEYALGEVGGATIWLAGKPIYPIQVAEKGLVWMTLRARGTAGHGSLPREDNAVVALADAVARLGKEGLPPRLVPVVARYLDALARTQSIPRALLLRQLRRPRLAPTILGMLAKADAGAARALRAVLANTATPTVLRAGGKTNVIPATAEAKLDGRSLPGQTAEDLVAEVERVVGKGVEVRVDKALPPYETTPDSPLYHAIVDTIARHHPEATCVPYLMPGFTDAKHWSRLGARCYGFVPVRFPDGGPRAAKFPDLFHGKDERIPVEGLRWGATVLLDLVRRFAS